MTDKDCSRLGKDKSRGKNNPHLDHHSPKFVTAYFLALERRELYQRFDSSNDQPQVINPPKIPQAIPQVPRRPPKKLRR